MDSYQAKTCADLIFKHMTDVRGTAVVDMESTGLICDSPGLYVKAAFASTVTFGVAGLLDMKFFAPTLPFFLPSRINVRDLWDSCLLHDLLLQELEEQHIKQLLFRVEIIASANQLVAVLQGVDLEALEFLGLPVRISCNSFRSALDETPRLQDLFAPKVLQSILLEGEAASESKRPLF